jgi:hypothetical protein
MDRSTADHALSDADLVPYLEGPVQHAKELERRLLAADIPVLLARPEPKECCSGQCGCASKLQLLIREDDVVKVQTLMQEEWLEALRREGTVGGEGGLVQLTASETGELPCPACGHVGALTEGACADCGLQLD